jgi:hypothetical protein
MKKIIRLPALLLCLIWGSNLLAQSGEIRGFVYDAKTGEPVIFSPVLLKGSRFGVNTDVNGFFSISKIPPGTYQLLVVNLIYDTIRESVTIEAGRIINRKFYLKEKIRELKAVEIKGSKNRQARENTVNTGIARITPKDIRSIPPMGGERDLAQYLQTIPGVTFTGDQGGQLFIRGGSNVQTLSLMDGMMVYNPFHSLGLFSVFDTDILKNVDVYTAAFPSEYGGRASSVIDVRTIDGNKNKISGKLGLNPFSAKAILEGPLLKNENGGGITFLASYRNSYLNKTSPFIYPYANESGRHLPFSFSDAYGKLTFHGDNGNKASLFGFNFRDGADLGKMGRFSWTSSGAGANFIMVPSSSTVLISGNLAYSGYQVRIDEATTNPRISEISNLNFGLDLTYFLNKNEFKYGVGVISNNTGFYSYDPKFKKEEQVANNAELFTYLKYRWNYSKRFILEPGLRVQYYASIGNLRMEPRAGAKFFLTEKIRLKGSLGLYSQNLVSTQSDRDVVALFQGFISSPDQVYGRNESITANPNNPSLKSRLQTSVHYVAGIEYDVNQALEISIEPYIKRFNNFINVNRNRIFPNQPLFISESGLARGIDFVVKYDQEPFLFQASYSLGKVDRSFNDLTYPPVFDRRHNINLMGSWNFGKEKDWDFNIRWNLGSGFPFTQTVAFYENLNLDGGLDQEFQDQNGNLGIYYGTESDFNQGRQPYYHRLDLSLSRIWKMANGTKLEGVFSVVNAYNRQNIFYFDRITYKRLNQLPLLPALGATWSF